MATRHRRKGTTEWSAFARSVLHMYLICLTATVNEYENGEDIGILRSKFTEAMRTNDTDRIIVWAGSSIGLMNKIQPAKVKRFQFIRWQMLSDTGHCE